MKKQIIVSTLSAILGASAMAAPESEKPSATGIFDQNGHVLQNMDIVVDPTQKFVVIPFEIASGGGNGYMNVGREIYFCDSKTLIVHKPGRFPAITRHPSPPPAEISEKITKTCGKYLP